MVGEYKKHFNDYPVVYMNMPVLTWLKKNILNQNKKFAFDDKKKFFFC